MTRQTREEADIAESATELAIDAGIKKRAARHVNLRKLAEGQPCLIRVPGVCTGGFQTTVLCHIRMVGLTGIGLKAPDVLGAFGCSDCHAVVDGQRKSDWSAGERRLMLLEGMARTQAWFVERGYLRW